MIDIEFCLNKGEWKQKFYQENAMETTFYGAPI